MRSPQLALWLSAIVLCVLRGSVGAQTAPADASALERELVTARSEARIPLLLDLADAAATPPLRALELTAEALELMVKSPPSPQLARACILRSRALQATAQYPAAHAVASRAESVASKLDRPGLHATARYQLAVAEWRMSNIDAALEQAGLARDTHAAEGLQSELASTLTLLGAIHRSICNLDRALECHLEALRLSEGLGDELGAARSHNNIGLIYWDLDRHAESLTALEHALLTYQRLGSDHRAAACSNNVGLVLIELDEPERALPHLDRARVLFEQNGNRAGLARAISNLGFARSGMGDQATALQLAEQALELRKAIGDRLGIVRSSGTIAGIWHEQGRVQDAIELNEEALELAREISARDEQAEILRALADIFEGLGDDSRALSNHKAFFETQTEIKGLATQKRIAELEARHAAAHRENELRVLATLARSREEQFQWLAGGSLLLGACLISVLVLYVTRSRAQRAVTESEQRYRALFQSSVVPTLLIENDGHRIIDLNDPARPLCGPIPENGYLAVDDIESDWVRAAVARVLESDASPEPAFDDCWIEHSGELRWTELRASSVAVDGRECRLVSVRDTTELRAHEEARLREDKIESLGVLAGGIAHDFNNALASIVGHVGLARDGDPSERREMLDSAEQAALHARTLTTQLLAFAKGGQPVRRLTDLKRLLRESVQLAGSGSRSRIELDIPDDLWGSEIDSGQFSQVVSNLVINAQQACSEGGRLTIRASNLVGNPITTSSGKERAFVRIDFEDDGPGIPEAVRHRIFDPYFTTKKDGSGLGLATAFAICKRHGGTLTFESRKGQGTTFHAYFPASTTTTPTGGLEPASEPNGAGSVLVLEDEPLVQNVLSRMLERWGFSVVAVDDGRAAVDRYLERLHAGATFDLLIMDLTIPGGMGGRQAMAEILTHDPHARAIVASGYSDDPTMADYRAAGFQAALAKPFRISDLAHAVNVVTQQDRRPQPTSETDRER